MYGEAPKIGVYGAATAGTFDAYGVRGDASGSSLAIYGRANSSGAGVFGHNIGAGRGGRFEINNTGNGSEALFAWTNGTGPAGHFQINNGNNSSNALNVKTNGMGRGAYIEINQSNNTSPGLEVQTNGRGYAFYGVNTGNGDGIYGEVHSSSGFAGYFEGRLYATGSIQTNGDVTGTSAFFDGVTAQVGGFSGQAASAILTASNSYNSINAHGLQAASDYGKAGLFLGDVQVNGDLDVSGSKNFKIDHPLDPANKYLYHFAIESSEVLNVYSGNITTDDEGYAEVTLPDWFEALNIDFRYQLTVVGAFAQAIVAEKVRDNRFVIRTNVPGVEVSWQVTGVRNDPGLRMRDRPVEEEKPEGERGIYLSPDAYGQDSQRQFP